ncbi:MAG: hypothetical protein JSU73_09795 [candidate division WOR-3 bacterium]|nr:MAG: hypothetical protein JSU73_09795 [candidate division WOR-3 bacterium]
MSEQSLKTALIAVLVLAGPGSALAEKTVFVSSPEYEVTIQLSYTRETSPEGEQGGFSSYTATGRFENVRFGPSQAEGFECWFQKQVEMPGGVKVEGAVVPAMQVSGRGTIDKFVIAPAWEDPNQAIEPEITSGPEPFEPYLQLLTWEMAHSEELESEDEIPVAPIVPTVWFMYREGYSVSGSELSWDYPGLAKGQVESSGVQFSVLLDKLARGEDIELEIPYTEGGAEGKWRIVFWSAEGQEE